MDALPPFEHDPSPARATARPVMAQPARRDALVDFPMDRRLHHSVHNRMRLGSLSRSDVLVDLLVFVGAMVIWIGLVVGTQWSLGFLQGAVSGEAAQQGGSAGDKEPGGGDGQGDGAATEIPKPVSLVAMMVAGAGSVAIVFLIHRWRAQPLRSLGLPGPKLLDFPLGAGVVVVGLCAHLYGMAWVLLLWPGAIDLMFKSSTDILAALPPGSIWLYVLIFVGVGFYEELIFRGFVLTRLRRLVGPWWLAVALTSALFAVLHLDLQQPTVLPSLFLLGCVFSTITVLRRSLWPAIIAHWLFNSMQLAYMHWASRQLEFFPSHS